MISKKGKRRIEYEGAVFYWFVRKNAEGISRIHILSEDKKVNLEYPLFDQEVSAVPSYIRCLLQQYFDKQ